MEIKCKCGNIGKIKELGYTSDDCDDVKFLDGFRLSYGGEYIYITCEKCGERICFAL